MKLNENITTKYLKVRYDVAANGTAAFEAALNDGTILGLIQANANESTGGDIGPVIDQLLRNNSSHRSNGKDKDFVSTSTKRIADMVALYETWLQARKAEVKKVKAAAAGTKARSVTKWFEYDRDQLLAMSLDKLNSVKACMASYGSKTKGTKTDATSLAKDKLHDELYNWTCDLCTERNARYKALKKLGIIVDTSIATLTEPTEVLKAMSEGKTRAEAEAEAEAGTKTETTAETKAEPTVDPALLKKLIDSQAGGKKKIQLSDAERDALLEALGIK